VRAFNGDPHPGNYLFHRGGRVTFLDFGLVRHFSPGPFVQGPPTTPMGEAEAAWQARHQAATA
jgi:hypothetical protein